MRRGWAFVLCALPALCAARAWLPQSEAPAASAALATQPMNFDAARTHLGFRLRTRWGQALEGWFPRYDASVTVLADGRHQVQLNLYVADLDVDDSPKYSDMARGEGFFDARRFPVVTWTSEPYDAALLYRGGRMPGTLSMHGVNRPKALELKPSPPGCARIGVDCDVLANGDVSRSDYGMGGWKLAIDDRVEFVLRMRMLTPIAPPVSP